MSVSRRGLVWTAGVLVALGIGIGGLLWVRGADGKARASGTKQAQGAAGKTAAKASKKKDSTNEPILAPVEVTTVRLGSISTFLETTTTLEPRNAATLIARRAGQVEAVLADEGQWVQRGALLARLEDREAKLAVERAELAAEVGTRELERGEQLAAQGYLSPRELDDLKLRRRTAWVELEQKRHELEQTRLRAPFSGRVSERHVRLGETVAAGSECFHIVDFSPILARLHFPERELARVRVGQEATLVFDPPAARPVTGRVTIVNPVVDQENGTFRVTVELGNGDGALRPGAFCRVRLRTGTHASAILIPRRGLLSEDGEEFVFVARGDSVVRVPVRIGAVQGDTAQVLTGLSAGERVVTVGQGGLKQGSKVKPVGA